MLHETFSPKHEKNFTKLGLEYRWGALQYTARNMLIALPFASRGIEAVVWTVIPGFIATITVVCRFWSRLLTKLPVGLDDWLVLVTLIVYYIIAVLAILAVKYGGSK